MKIQFSDIDDALAKEEDIPKAANTVPRVIIFFSFINIVYEFRTIF